MDSNPHSHTLQKHSKENTGSFQGINRHTICVSAQLFQKDKKSRRKKRNLVSIDKNSIGPDSDMTQMLELSAREFKITVTNRLTH